MSIRRTSSKPQSKRERHLHPPGSSSNTPPSSSRQPSPSPENLHLRARNLRGQASRNHSDTSLASGTHANDGAIHETKPGGPLDWYVEGPGRRVGYDDLTAIDWIFEYTKERQRLRVLISSTQGFTGYVRQLLDASHVWIVLILTGVAVGILAAAINIASDWLSDIKFGYCRKSEQGGQFYLNKAFCCWGHDGQFENTSRVLVLTPHRLFPVSRLDTMAKFPPDLRKRRGLCDWIFLLLHLFSKENASCAEDGTLKARLRLPLQSRLRPWSRSTRYLQSTAEYRK